MNTNMSGRVRRGVTVCGVALASAMATPATAYAAGADILLPKPAEFIPALIAFLVIWIILAKLAWPSIVKILDEREEKIGGDLKAAEDARAEAEATVRAQEEKIEAANREAADIIAAAKREAEEERAAILNKAQKDAVAVMAKARDVVESERKKALVDLSSSIVDLSVEIASKIVGNDLTDEQHRALAMRYLEEVGSSNGND